MKAKKEIVVFHTEADRKKYLQKLKKEYEEEKTGVFYDTAEIIKYLNAGSDHEPHPALGCAEIVFGGASLLLQLMNAEMTLTQLPYLAGAALVTIAGANNLDDKSKYRGPFMTILSIPLAPLIFAGVSIAKVVEKINQKKTIKKIENTPITPTKEEQLEFDKEQLKYSIDQFEKSIDVSKSEVLKEAINEIKDLEELLLHIYTPYVGIYYIAKLQEKVSSISEEYFKGNIKPEDFLSLIKKETESLRNQVEQAKLEEYELNEDVSPEEKAFCMELIQKRKQRIEEKEAN